MHKNNETFMLNKSKIVVQTYREERQKKHKLDDLTSEGKRTKMSFFFPPSFHMKNYAILPTSFG